MDESVHPLAAIITYKGRTGERTAIFKGRAMFKVGDTVKVTEEGLIRYGQTGIVVFVKDANKTYCPNVVEFASGYGDYKDDDLQLVETRTFDEIQDDRYRHECRPGLTELELIAEGED